MAAAGIQGLDVLIGRIDAISALLNPDALVARTLDEAEAIGNEMADMARNLAPVGKRPDDDRIIDGITVERFADRVEIRSRSRHSLFVEFGTVHQAAQPFFRPSYYAFRYFSTIAKNRQEELLKAIGR
jgi:HK97 gp10 family phage protein